MFNSHIRKFFMSVTRSMKPALTLEPRLRGDIGHNTCQFMNPVRHFRQNRIKIPRPKEVYYPEMPEDQEVVEDNSIEEMNITKDVVSKVNSQISEHSHGRLFAVIYLKGNQYKITEGDLIVTEGSWAPEPGDALRLEKVLLVGCSDFTLVGRPLLLPDLVRVTATVTDKTLEATRYFFKYRARKMKKTSHFNRTFMTTMRINSIELTSLLDEHRDVEGLQGRVF